MKLRTVSRSAVGAPAWDEFVRGQLWGWFWHSSRWIDYALAYTPGSVDCSSATVQEDGDIVGVTPLVLAPDGAFVNGGQPIAMPLGVAEPVRLLREPRAGRPGQLVDGSISSTRAVRTSVVDLRKTTVQLWSALRRSYKPLINRARRDYHIEVYRSEPDALLRAATQRAQARMHEAHGIHRQVSGRETRSQRTWDLQAEWLRDGYGVLAVAYKGATPRAFTYTIAWKDWSYYASSASLDGSVSHALVWESMLLLRAAGVSYFELSHGLHAESPKDRSIEFFMSGFGGDEWMVGVSQEEPCPAAS